MQKPNPYRVQKYLLTSFRAKQMKAIQDQRLKAMNSEMRRIRKNYDDYTHINKPNAQVIEAMYTQRKKKKSEISDYEEYVYDKKKWESVKDITEIVLSNYAHGNYNVIDKNISKSVYVKGYYP